MCCSAVVRRQKCCFDRISRHQVTVLASVPTALQRLLDHDPDAKLSSLRLITSAGEARLRSWPIALFFAPMGVEILDGLARQRCFTSTSRTSLETCAPVHSGSLCRGYAARIVRPDAAATRNQGKLARCGSKATRRHCAISKRTSRAKPRCAETGWYPAICSTATKTVSFYDGRADDLLKVGGIFVSPLEVENVLTGHPAVVEMRGCRRRKSARSGPRAGLCRDSAAVTAPTTALADALIQHCKTKSWRTTKPQVASSS